MEPNTAQDDEVTKSEDGFHTIARLNPQGQLREVLPHFNKHAQSIKIVESILEIFMLFSGYSIRENEDF